MTRAAPLIVDATITQELHDLRDLADAAPLDIQDIRTALHTAMGRRRHRKRMQRQTVAIPGAPWPFFVTYSREVGHGAGACRHMSMSVAREDRVPHPAAVWLIAAELGFLGSIDDCAVWVEDLSRGGRAVNVLQPVPG